MKKIQFIFFDSDKLQGWGNYDEFSEIAEFNLRNITIFLAKIIPVPIPPKVPNITEITRNFFVIYISNYGIFRIDLLKFSLSSFITESTQYRRICQYRRFFCRKKLPMYYFSKA